jgi:hypothetical protein
MIELLTQLLHEFDEKRQEYCDDTENHLNRHVSLTFAK